MSCVARRDCLPRRRLSAPGKQWPEQLRDELGEQLRQSMSRSTREQVVGADQDGYELTARCGRQLPQYRMDRRERPPDRRDRPPSEGALGYESTCAAGWTRSKSSFREMLSVSAVMSTTLPSRICIKKA
jgi:hypothetical protein